MTPKQNIGDILMGFGRIDQDEVDRALEYQRENGGYFGEALIALGVVSPEEIEWSLASQFDLPYVFPDAESVDPEAVSLVTPEWALAHLTLPITRSGRSVTAVVDSPMRTQAVSELAERTGCEVSLALASAGHIRELIRTVFARTDEGVADRPTPISLEEGLALTLGAVSEAFGVSTRGRKSIFWYDDGGEVRRRLLLPEWSPQLDAFMDPSPRDHVHGRDRAVFTARLNRRGLVGSVTVRYLADESGEELLMRPVEEPADPPPGFTPPPPGIVSEVRMLARSGAGRFLIVTDPDELGHGMLPRIPDVLLDPHWRSIYVHSDSSLAANRAFSLAMPEEEEQWAGELEALRGFRFDVVTVDLEGSPDAWVKQALEIASVAFVLWPGDADRGPARDAGIRWELDISEGSDDQLAWSLNPLS
jgi:type IV pilus assembly protein PilB